MSPEQARGKPVDKRADIWAFGVVLFEMLTGKPLFPGETVSDTLAAVLTREPEWEQVPPKVRRLLRRCLEKDPARRLRDISGVGLLLEEPPEVKQIFYTGNSNLALAPDGKRFAVFPMPEAAVPRYPAVPEKGPVHVTFLLNFLDELRRRIPVR